MTFEDWLNSSSEHYFDFLSFVKYCDLQSLTEWDGWVEHINNLLSTMAYEDAMGCDMENLISLAGLTGEIELALKEHRMDERMDKLNEDFK